MAHSVHVKCDAKKARKFPNLSQNDRLMQKFNDRNEELRIKRDHESVVKEEIAETFDRFHSTIHLG